MIAGWQLTPQLVVGASCCGRDAVVEGWRRCRGDWPTDPGEDGGRSA